MLYLCGQQPNRIVKNEIDHLLTNDVRLIRDISVPNVFVFPSDHRIKRCSLRNQKSTKFKRYNYMKGNKCKNIDHTYVLSRKSRTRYVDKIRREQNNKGREVGSRKI